MSFEKIKIVLLIAAAIGCCALGTALFIAIVWACLHYVGVV